MVASCPAEQEIHIILDNLSAHQTGKVRQFLEENPQVPTLHSDLLFLAQPSRSKLQRDVIIRGIFTSVQDLARKIMGYIRIYDKTAKPYKWKYNDVTKRIRKY